MKKPIALMIVGLALLGLAAQEVQPVQAPPQDPSPPSSQEAAPVAAPAENPHGLRPAPPGQEDRGVRGLPHPRRRPGLLLPPQGRCRAGRGEDGQHPLLRGLPAGQSRARDHRAQAGQRRRCLPALLVPASFVSASKDLAPALPGGIQFYWSKGSMEYDFRILSSRLFLRVRGIYTNCSDLGTLAARVLADPQSYITASNPPPHPPAHPGKRGQAQEGRGDHRKPQGRILPPRDGRHHRPEWRQGPQGGGGCPWSSNSSAVTRSWARRRQRPDSRKPSSPSSPRNSISYSSSSSGSARETSLGTE